MSLKELTKEQKQYIALAALVAFGVVGGIVFGVKVSLSSIDKAKLELQELEGRIKGAQRSLTKQERMRSDFSETVDALKAYLKDAPPNQNYYSWATEVIYSIARKASLDVDAIDEQSQPGGVEPGDDQTLAMESYALRITSHGSYEALKAFLRLIEEKHPLARVTAVDVSSGAEPEIHDIGLVVQWPFNLHSVAEVWDDIDAKKLAVENGEGVANSGSASKPSGSVEE